MAFWKIIITGETEKDVHGVGLREFIAKVARVYEPKLDGIVRNIKNSERIEITCRNKEDGKILIERITNGIKNNPLIDIEKINLPHDEYEVDDKGIEIEKDKFKVIREDELTEMVWALQAAGEAVLSQEKIRTKKIINGLHYELKTIWDKITNKDNDSIEKIISEGRRDEYYKIRFTTLSIAQFLKEPPALETMNIDTKVLCSHLHILYNSCKIIEKVASLRLGRKELIEPFDEIVKVMKEIQPFLTKMQI